MYKNTWFVVPVLLKNREKLGRTTILFLLDFWDGLFELHISSMMEKLPKMHISLIWESSTAHCYFHCRFTDISPGAPQKFN